MEGENGIVFIILAGEQSGQLLGLQISHDKIIALLGFLIDAFIVHLNGKFDQCQCIVISTAQLFIALEHILDMTHLPDYLLGVLLVIPESAYGSLSFQLLKTGLLILNVHRLIQVLQLAFLCQQPQAQFFKLQHIQRFPFFRF